MSDTMNKDLLHNLPEEESRLIGEITHLANREKIPVYLIGGYVRDLLLQRPSRDIDFVCLGAGSGIRLAKLLAKELEGHSGMHIFKNFGTANIRFGSYHLEFVGARKESYRLESRKPLIEDGTLEDDLNRRDFTINALAISLNTEDKGRLIDPFHGLDDLEKRIIRTPLDPVITFSDDPLRMMRAIRFATQLGFTIEKKTLEAIAHTKERIHIISTERITEELNKIILAGKPSIGFRLLEETGLLALVFPELCQLKGVEKVDDKAHKDNFFHTLQVLDNVAKRTDNLWLRWAAILHDIGKPASKKFHPETGWTFHGHDAIGARMVPEIFRKMRLPMNESMRYVQKLVLLHLRPISLVGEQVTDSAIRRLLFDAGDDIDDLMLLCRADITSKNKQKVKQYLANFEKVRQKAKEVEEKDRIRNWQPPVNGKIIMETFGIRPGSEVGIIKNAIREAILDGEISNNFEEAYQFMIKKGRELGLTVVRKAKK